jgi:hypothetical protein
LLIPLQALKVIQNEYIPLAKCFPFIFKGMRALVESCMLEIASGVWHTWETPPPISTDRTVARRGELLFQLIKFIIYMFTVIK